VRPAPAQAAVQLVAEALQLLQALGLNDRRGQVDGAFRHAFPICR